MTLATKDQLHCQSVTKLDGGFRGETGGEAGQAPCRPSVAGKQGKAHDDLTTWNGPTSVFENVVHTTLCWELWMWVVHCIVRHLGISGVW
jgi:hypothetical protein